MHKFNKYVMVIGSVMVILAFLVVMIAPIGVSAKGGFFSTLLTIVSVVSFFVGVPIPLGGLDVASGVASVFGGEAVMWSSTLGYYTTVHSIPLLVFGAGAGVLAGQPSGYQQTIPTEGGGGQCYGPVNSCAQAYPGSWIQNWSSVVNDENGQIMYRDLRNEDGGWLIPGDGGDTSSFGPQYTCDAPNNSPPESSCPCVTNKGDVCTGTNACGQSYSSTPGDQCYFSLFGTCLFSINTVQPNQGAGTTQCDGTCSGLAPPLPIKYNETCNSTPNSCQQTAIGVVACDGSCNATKPSDNLCPTCQDPQAINRGQSLPCRYPPTPPATCSVLPLPQCSNGILISNGNDSSGCSLGYTCQINPPPTCRDPQANNIGGATPCIYPPTPTTCQDPQATNKGGSLPCAYVVVDPALKCQDTQAKNIGGNLPCTYQGTPTTCQDPQATNKGGSLPCAYTACPQVSPPQCTNGTLVSKGSDSSGCNIGYLCRANPTTCQDPNANNIGGDLPCTYPTTCQDSNANNINQPLPCTFSTCQDTSANNVGRPLPCTYRSSCPSGFTGTYPNCAGPDTCPTGYTGAYPNCVGVQACPSGYTGMYPNCAGTQTGGSCPTGFTGTYPVCTGTTGGSGNCPTGFTGIYPDCTGPNTCPTNFTGTYPNCVGPQTCSNGTSNPPTCTLTTTGACSNGATNPPACTFSGSCSIDKMLVSGSCVPIPVNIGTFVATPGRILYNTTTKLSWESIGASINGCAIVGKTSASGTSIISKNGLNRNNVNSPFSSPKLMENTDFTLTCENTAGMSDSETIQVKVITPTYQEF